MLTTLSFIMPLPSLQEMTGLECYVLDFNKPKKTDTIAFYVNCRANGPCAAARQATFLELGTMWILFGAVYILCGKSATANVHWDNKFSELKGILITIWTNDLQCLASKDSVIILSTEPTFWRI